MSETKAPDYEVKKKVYEIVINGEAYEVRKPTYREQKEMARLAKEAGEEDAADVTLDNLRSLGMPENLDELLDVDDIIQISQLVYGGKKK